MELKFQLYAYVLSHVKQSLDLIKMYSILEAVNANTLKLTFTSQTVFQLESVLT